jgi:hypothetical protein
MIHEHGDLRVAEAFDGRQGTTAALAGDFKVSVGPRRLRHES